MDGQPTFSLGFSVAGACTGGLTAPPRNVLTSVVTHHWRKRAAVTHPPLSLATAGSCVRNAHQPHTERRHAVQRKILPRELAERMGGRTASAATAPGWNTRSAPMPARTRGRLRRRCAACAGREARRLVGQPTPRRTHARRRRAAAPATGRARLWPRGASSRGGPPSGSHASWWAARCLTTFFKRRRREQTRHWQQCQFACACWKVRGGWWRAAAAAGALGVGGAHTMRNHTQDQQSVIETTLHVNVRHASRRVVPAVVRTSVFGDRRETSRALGEACRVATRPCARWSRRATRCDHRGGRQAAAQPRHVTGVLRRHPPPRANEGVDTRTY